MNTSQVLSWPWGQPISFQKIGARAFARLRGAAIFFCSLFWPAQPHEDMGARRCAHLPACWSTHVANMSRCCGTKMERSESTKLCAYEGLGLIFWHLRPAREDRVLLIAPWHPEVSTWPWFQQKLLQRQWRQGECSHPSLPLCWLTQPKATIQFAGALAAPSFAFIFPKKGSA